MNSPTEKPNYYLVRTSPELLDRGMVGVGWADFRFAEIGDAEEAIRLINEDYGVGRWGNQIRRFYHIAEGDLVVVPVPYAVAIGTAKGGLIYDRNFYEQDQANQRRVDFLRDQEGQVVRIPRNSFSEAFQRRLRVQGMTVNDLGEFEDEIRSAFSSLARGSDHSWLNDVNVEIGRQRENFKKKLLDNIQSGKTNLQAGGVGLENLVRELLTVEGYTARVLSKHHFGGEADADIQASRTDRCASVRLLVQVKHHQGYSNAHGIHQLLEIQRAHAGEYDGHQRVFVTSASVSEEVLKVAVDTGVTVIGGLELADWISEHIEKLAPETKLALGIYEVPAVL